MPWCDECRIEYYRQCRGCFKLDPAEINDDGSNLGIKKAADQVTSGLKESDGEAVASSRGNIQRGV